MKFLMIVLFSFSSFFGFGQLYKGKVIDSQSEPIAYADIVAYRTSDNTLITGTSSMEDGSFKLKVKSEVNFYIEISFLGFKTKKITPKQSNLGTISLNETGVNLKEVVVTARKKIIKREVDRLVFNVEASSKSSAGDAMEVLKVTPSLRVRNDRITMIGKSGMRIMVNDKLIRLSGNELINYLSSIPSDDIKNIEVITSPPAKYDAEGNSGLININLKKTQNNSWNAQLWSYYRQRVYPLGSFGGSFRYNKNKLSINSSISYRNGIYYKEQENYTYFPSSVWFLKEPYKASYDGINTRFDVNYQVAPTWSMGVQYMYSTTNAEYNMKPFTREYNITTNETISTLNSVSSIVPVSKMNSFNYNNIFKLPKKKKITLDFDYFNFKTDEASNYDGIRALSLPNTLQFYKGINNNNQKITNFSSSIDFDFPTNFLKFNFGGKVSNTKSLNDINYFNSGLVNQNIIQATPLSYNDFEYKESILAFYLSVSRKFSKKTSAKAGLRMENTETKSVSKNLAFNVNNSYIKFFPTFYLSYNASKNSTFAFNYSKRIQRPSFLELNPNKNYSDPFKMVEGNAFLKPAFIDNLELTNSFKNLESKIYYSYESDMFSQIPIADVSSNFTKFTNQNYINRHRYGISESYRFNKIKWWTSTNSVDFNYSVTKFNLKTPQASRKGYSATLSTNNDFILNKDKTLKGGVNFWYDFPAMDGVFDVKSMSSLSFFLQYLLLDKKLRLTLRANDVFKGTAKQTNATINDVFQKARYYYDSQYFQISASYRFGNQKIRAKRNKTGNREERRRTQ